MKTSESIKSISTALFKFHKEVTVIEKKEQNPFFNSKYADLSEVLSTIKEPLQKSGLIFVQFPDEAGLTTRLIHVESGEWFEAHFTMIYVKNDPQAQGSAITYTRRNVLKSILGLNEVDDDGNAASKPIKQQSKPSSNEIKYEEVQSPSVNQQTDICEICGASASYKQGKTKNGRDYAGIFCSANKRHVKWL
jgi:hypothetical protein